MNTQWGVRRFLHRLRIRLMGKSEEEEQYEHIQHYLKRNGVTLEDLVARYRRSQTLWGALVRGGLVSEELVDTNPGVLEVAAGLSSPTITPYESSW